MDFNCEYMAISGDCRNRKHEAYGGRCIGTEKCAAASPVFSISEHTEGDKVVIDTGDISKKPDMVNHPPHYTSGKYECIDVIYDVISQHKDPIAAWLTAQIIKYIWRWPLKNGVEDLKKIRFYLDRLIEHEESKNG